LREIKNNKKEIKGNFEVNKKINLTNKKLKNKNYIIVI